MPIIHLPPAVPPQEAPEPEGDKNKATKGGGGGGHEQNDPATDGVPPLFSPEQPMIAPTTKPTLHPPDLPIRETLLGDLTPRRDDLQPTGLPNANVGPPSDGPGTNGGIGSGDHNGVGPGNGPGFGPGDGGRQAGGENTVGKHRPDTNEAVDTRPVPLNRPRPNYTETARQNKVQGVVRARVLVGADGAVKQVKILGAGLPDGLNEEAIRAATQMRFQPATRSGQPVAHWVTVEIEFNIR